MSRRKAAFLTTGPREVPYKKGTPGQRRDAHVPEYNPCLIIEKCTYDQRFIDFTRISCLLLTLKDNVMQTENKEDYYDTRLVPTTRNTPETLNGAGVTERTRRFPLRLGVGCDN